MNNGSMKLGEYLYKRRAVQGNYKYFFVMNIDLYYNTCVDRTNSQVFFEINTNSTSPVVMGVILVLIKH